MTLSSLKPQHWQLKAIIVHSWLSEPLRASRKGGSFGYVNDAIHIQWKGKGTPFSAHLKIMNLINLGVRIMEGLDDQCSDKQGYTVQVSLLYNSSN